MTLIIIPKVSAQNIMLEYLTLNFCFITQIKKLKRSFLDPTVTEKEVDPG